MRVRKGACRVCGCEEGHGPARARGWSLVVFALRVVSEQRVALRWCSAPAPTTPSQRPTGGGGRACLAEWRCRLCACGAPVMAPSRARREQG